MEPQPPIPTDIPRARRALVALLRWFDNEAPGDGAPDERIDWLRVVPFIGLHLACFAVAWVGVSATAARGAGAGAGAGAERSGASTVSARGGMRTP